MSPLARRRTRNLSLVLVAGLLFAWWQWSHPVMGPRANLVTGWSMVIAMVLLLLFNPRKKLTFLPLGRVSAWTQLHLYLGLLTAGLFLLHTRLSLPSGMLDATLYFLVSLTLASGFAGILISRLLPPRIRRTGIEITYNNIAPRIAELRREIEALTIEATAESGRRGLAELHEKHLRGWLAGARDRWPHLLASDHPRQRLERCIRDYERLLASAETARLAAIRARLDEKLKLDYIHAQQWLLRNWLLWHIPPAAALALFVVIHVLTVYAFVGGIR